MTKRNGFSQYKDYIMHFGLDNSPIFKDIENKLVQKTIAKSTFNLELSESQKI